MADTKESLARKRKAYLNTFCGDFDHPHVDGAAVLADLKRFCQAEQPGIVVSPKSGTVDPYASIYRAALRDVYARITGFIGIDIEKLFNSEVQREQKVSDSSES